MLINGVIYDEVEGEPRYDLVVRYRSGFDRKYSFMNFGTVMNVYNNLSYYSSATKSCKLIDRKTGITLRKFGYRRLEQHLTKSGAHE